MGLFDPKVEANISPTQQVSAGPSGLQVFASVVGTAMDAYGAGMKVAGSNAPTSAERRSGLEDAQFVGLSNSLLKVEALRRDGRIAEADRAEQMVLANAARDGLDLSSGQTKALFRATTGRDPQHMGMSQEEVVNEKIMATPEFQNMYIASYANGQDMTPEQRRSFAMAQIARTQSHAMTMQNETITWHEGRQQAFSGVVQAFQATNLGSLSLAAAEGKIIPIKMLDQSQASWEATKSQLIGARPSGLEDKDWKSVQAQIDSVDATFSFLRSISTGEAIDARIAQLASAAIAQMEINPLQKQMLAKIITNPDAILAFNIASPAEMKELLEAAYVTPFDTNGEFVLFSEPTTETGKNADGTPKLFPDSIMKDIEGMDPAELLKQAGNITKSIRMGGTAALAQDADQRGAVVSTLSKAFAAMTTISKDNKEFVSGNKVNEVFDGTVISAIDEIAKVAPSQARTLLRQGEEALNQQDAVASAALQNLISSSAGFGFENGKVVINAEAMDNLGWKKEIKDGFKGAAEKFYGGDLAALFLDQGRKIDPSSEKFKQTRALARGGFAAGLNAGVKQLNDMATTVNTIRNKRNEFRTRADALTAKPEEVSEEEAAIFAAEVLGTVEATKIRGFSSIANDTPFLNEVNAVSNRLGINPNDLIAIMSFETVGTFMPSIKNPESTATGLIQFLEDTAEGLGTSTGELSQMSRLEQMAYVEAYLKPYKGRVKNLGDIYMAVHWPAAIGKDGSYVMYKKGSKAYDKNRTLDVSGDGTVTRAETLTRLNSVFKGGPGITVSKLPPPAEEAEPEAEAVDIESVALRAIERSEAEVVEPVEGTTEPEAEPGAEPGAEPEAEAGFQSVGKEIAAELDSKALRQLTALGIDPKTVGVFKSVEEAQTAIKNGEVKVGDAIFIDGELIIVEDA